MKDIIRLVTVYSHELFGEIRTVKDDDGELLFVVTDVANCLRYKDINYILKSKHIKEVPVMINCIAAINTDRLVLDAKMINTIYCKDVFKLINASYRVDARVFELWLMRDILKNRKNISFNVELYKDEYIQLQQSELDILKSKLFLLEKYILQKKSKGIDMHIEDENYYDDLYKENINIKGVNVYYHKLYGEIRTINKNNEILFIANDIAKCLKFKKPQANVKECVAKMFKIPVYQDDDRRVVNVIPFSEVQVLINRSTKVDKRMFELWIRSEILGEDNCFEKNVVYYGEYYKDEYIKVLSKEIKVHQNHIKLLEDELFSSFNMKVVQDNENLITNYDLYKNL